MDPVLDRREILFICNCLSGKKKHFSHIEREIRSSLETNSSVIIWVETYTVEAMHSAVKKAYASGMRNFIAVGGDGTLHHLINSLAMCGNGNEVFQLCTIGVLPCGTGNDYVRSLPSFSQEKLLHAIRNDRTRLVDLGQIGFENGSIRYFMNIAGIGFNAEVVKSLNPFRILGSFAYYFALIKSFFGYRPQLMDLRIDGVRYSESTFLLTVGIGQYAGGGMKLCPSAILDDSYFEIHLIRAVKKLDLILKLHTLSDGRYLNHLDCISRMGQHIEVNMPCSLEAEADGEYLGEGIQSFRILPKSLRIYCE